MACLAAATGKLKQLSVDASLPVADLFAKRDSAKAIKLPLEVLA
jgi:hypothetical protein